MKKQNMFLFAMALTLVLIFGSVGTAKAQVQMPTADHPTSTVAVSELTTFNKVHKWSHGVCIEANWFPLYWLFGWSSGPCPEPEVLGCTDPQALNYDPEATEDDGSCEYPVLGCTDPQASNYDEEATEDDGSCEYPVLGCTDPQALNYDPEATEDDGSCEYEEEDPVCGDNASYDGETCVCDPGYTSSGGEFPVCLPDPDEPEPNVVITLLGTDNYCGGALVALLDNTGIWRRYAGSFSPSSPVDLNNDGKEDKTKVVYKSNAPIGPEVVRFYSLCEGNLKLTGQQFYGPGPSIDKEFNPEWLIDVFGSEAGVPDNWEGVLPW